jgi:hypothetical protein
MSRRIQIIILIFVVLIGIRVFLIYRERNAPAPVQKQAAPNPNFSADDYVVPTQVHAYDLKSAKEALDGKTVWVKAGNQVYYYPYASGRVDFKHPAGLLAPLDKLEISNVIQATSPDAKAEEVAPGVRVRAEQVMAVFHRGDDKKTYAAPIGGNRGGDYNLYINETFFVDDPHELYKHWPADIWNAIGEHQAKQGMNELQVAMALGVGIPQGSAGEYGNRTLQYDNNGHPVKVTFEHNHATSVQSGAGS